jgi:hypothetical protein
MSNYGPGQPPPPPGQPPQGYPVPGQPGPGPQGYPPQPYPPQPYPPAAAPQPQYQQPPPAAPYSPEPPPGGPKAPGTIVGNPRPAGPTFQAPNPPGKRRGTFPVILLSIITLFIYFFYWHAKVFQELRRRRDKGPGGGIGFFSTGGVGAWLLPGTIRDAYVEAGREPPVTSMTGWWNLLPLVGFFVWVAKCNGALNRLWEGD